MAITFDSTTKYISQTVDATDSPITTKGSVAFWVKPAWTVIGNATAHGFFEYRATSPAIGYLFAWNYNVPNELWIGLWNASSDGRVKYDLDSGGLVENVWNHVCVTWNMTVGGANNRVRLYINGVLKATVTGTFASLPTVLDDGSRNIGRSVEGPTTANGAMDEFAEWYDRELTQDDIDELQTFVPTAVHSTDINNYFTMTAAYISGTTLTNRAGSHANTSGNGTINGSPSVTAGPTLLSGTSTVRARSGFRSRGFGVR